MGSLEVDGEGAEAAVGGEPEGGARVEYLMKELRGIKRMIRLRKQAGKI